MTNQSKIKLFNDQVVPFMTNILHTIYNIYENGKEDSKMVISDRKSKKNRQHNNQKKIRTQGQTMIYKTLHKKLKIEQHSLAPEG